MAKLRKPLSLTYFKDYPQKKYKVQTTKQIEGCLERLEWYRSSYLSKEDRNLFKLYKTVDDYWEGQANQQEYKDDPASNTNVIHPFIEGQVALMVDENIEVNPRAQTPSEVEYIQSIKMMLDFVLENNKKVQIMDVDARRLLKYGTSILNVLYDPDWGNKFGLPIIKSCNPSYIFPDPNIVDIYSTQEGKFLIETVTKSIHWASMTFGEEKASLIVPGFDPYHGSTFYDENEYNSSEIQRMHYVHLLVWEKYKDDDSKKIKLRLIMMSGDGIELYNSEEKNYEFCSNSFPYFFTPCYFREGTVWGKGDAENLLDQQEQINDLDDQLLMNARLTGNPQKWFDPSLVPDGEMWSNGEGLILPAPDGAAGYFIPPSMPHYIVAKRNRIMDIDCPSITRFYPQMVGGRIKGVDTATEALSMQESGRSGVDQKKRLMAATWSDMMEYVLKMCIFHWDKEKYFTITGKEGFLEFNPSSLNSIPVKKLADDNFVKGFMAKNPKGKIPEYMLDTTSKGKPKTKKADVRVQVTMGTGLPKNKAFQYTAIKELYAMQLIDAETTKKLLVNMIGIPIPVQSEITPDVQQDVAQMQKDSMNVSGIPISGNQLKTAQGTRADKAINQSGSPMGVKAKDIMKTQGSI